MHVCIQYTISLKILFVGLFCGNLSCFVFQQTSRVIKGVLVIITLLQLPKTELKTINEFLHFMAKSAHN